jgi:hypothetical protein
MCFKHFAEECTHSKIKFRFGIENNLSTHRGAVLKAGF